MAAHLAGVKVAFTVVTPPSYYGFSFVLETACLFFFGGFSVLLLMVVEQLVEILVFLQEMSSNLSTLLETIFVRCVFSTKINE